MAAQRIAFVYHQDTNDNDSAVTAELSGKEFCEADLDSLYELFRAAFVDAIREDDDD